MISTKYQRQEGIFNPSEQRLKITIIGVGSSGSFIAFCLAKMGFNDIEIIDFDRVEEHNIPNQFYRMSDIGRPKVEALYEIIRDFTGIEVKYYNYKIEDEESHLDLSLDRLYILCMDNIEGRKAVWSQLKGSPLKIIDGGLGGEEFYTQVIECDNPKHQAEYEVYLNTEHKDLPCGYQNILYTIFNECSEICNLVKRIDKKEPIPTKLMRDMRGFRVITNEFSK